MRKLIAAVLVAGATLVVPAIAADFPEYPPVIDIPDVDYGVQGSFYLRGSAALNSMWAKEVNHPTAIPTTFAIDGNGYGYSVGAGGRLVIRESGTEPVIRVMGEADDAALVSTVVGQIEAAIKEVA